MYFFRRSICASTFWSVSIRRVIAMAEQWRVEIEYHSVPAGGSTMCYQTLSWDHVSTMAIGQIMYPYTPDEIEDIFVDGTRVRRTDFDSRRSFVCQLAWTPRNYDIHIYLDVYLEDDRNEEEDDGSDYYNGGNFRQISPRDPMTRHIPPPNMFMEIYDGSPPDLISWKVIPWTFVSVMPIGRLIAPYTLHYDVEEIRIDNTRVRHLDFDSSRSLVDQLAWIPRKVHIYLDVHRNEHRQYTYGLAYRDPESTSCGSSSHDDDFDDDYDDQFFSM